MKTIFGLPEADAFPQRPVATLGMYDGVHLGHRAVLDAALSRAREAGCPAVVLTFDAHPRGLLHGQRPPMITSLEHRLVLFEAAGMDTCIVLPFDETLSQMPALEFVTEIFCKRMNARAIVLGYDCHFGRNREGNLEFLRQHKCACSFDVVEVGAVEVEGQEVGSTAIRSAILGGDLTTAAKMLGRSVEAMGTVVSGKGLGRRLGFPTLNLNLHHELHPPQGVYVSRTTVGDTSWPSVTFVGLRPTSDAAGPDDVIVESHVYGRNIGDLYGQTARVEFFDKLRDVARFPDQAALIDAIGKDVKAAEAWVQSRK